MDDCGVCFVWPWPVELLASEGDNMEAEREMRYQKILQVKNLKSLAKTQESELATLQAEVERLRRRNFPLLAQPLHKWGPPLQLLTILFTLTILIYPNKIILM